MNKFLSKHVLTKRVIISTLVAILLAFSFYLWQLFLVPTPVTTHMFRVEATDTVNTIAARLKDEGIIKHRTYYYFTYFIFGTHIHPKPGAYELSTDMRIRDMVFALEHEPSAKYITIPANLPKEKIADILADALHWSDLDRQYFPETYAGMQWQEYQENLGEIFTKQYDWTPKKAEVFLTLSSLYNDPAYDFFKNMYIPGTYEIPVNSSRAQVAGILIDNFVSENKDSKAALSKYLDKPTMDNIAKLIETEMVLVPDIVAVPPNDLALKKADGKTYLLFTASYWNKGRGPLELIADPKTRDVPGDVERNVYQRIYNLDGNYTERLAGTFLWHAEHLHYHYSDFAVYQLEPVDIGGAAFDNKILYKSSFCLRDIQPIDLSHPGASKVPSYRVCGKERQGISQGWADSYYYTYVDQKLDVTDAPKGIYKLKIIVNPNDRFEEITKGNNVGETVISLDAANNKIEVVGEQSHGI